MQVPDEVVKFIKSSGNNFHAKVARWLTEQDWHVVVSPYYMDQSQNKAREIDLIAEKVCASINDCIADRAVGDVVVRLFFECKYVTSPTVFWFADKDMEQATELVCRHGKFRRDNLYTEKHHYLSRSPKVAKLFASSKDKQSENEPFYKALNQSLNAMVSMQGAPVTIPASKRQRRARGSEIVLEYPVVVCNSFKDLYSVDFYTDSEPAAISDNFQLEVRYAYFDHAQKQRNDYFLLDFVEFDKLSDFFDAVTENARAAASLAC